MRTRSDKPLSRHVLRLAPASRRVEAAWPGSLLEVRFDANHNLSLCKLLTKRSRGRRPPKVMKTAQSLEPRL